ncbi:hypothetical protein [Candidatus Nitrosotalea okcheonensis]|nr:hypothetical protein [Candidatus Nitrosotalea okcheonensis]
MGNQAKMYKQKPDSTGLYGFKATWVGPQGIKQIADNMPSGADKWASAGTLLAFLTGGGYIETSITYASSISGQSVGWKFWCGLNGSGPYQSLTNDPTNKSVGLTLKKVGTTWHAIYNNFTDNENYDVVIPNAPNQTLNTSDVTWLMHETSTNTGSCVTPYSSFIDIDFNNVKYLDSSGNPTSQVPTAMGQLIDTNMSGCIAIDETHEKIYHL